MRLIDLMVPDGDPLTLSKHVSARKANILLMSSLVGREKNQLSSNKLKTAVSRESYCQRGKVA